MEQQTSSRCGSFIHGVDDLKKQSPTLAQSIEGDPQQKFQGQ